MHSSLQPMSTTLRIVPPPHASDDDTAPLVRYDLLQLRESRETDTLAAALVDLVYGMAITEAPRREQASCRYLATHALRSSKDYWRHAATDGAMSAVLTHLREASGSQLAQWDESRRVALARELVGACLSAYHGITEGTTALAPGRYLRIVQGTR